MTDHRDEALKLYRQIDILEDIIRTQKVCLVHCLSSIDYAHSKTEDPYFIKVREVIKSTFDKVAEKRKGII